MPNDPKILVLALLGGTIPALLWLWFWLKQEEKKSEPRGLLTIIFLLGMASVLFVLPVQKFIQIHIDSQTLQVISWASIEEIFKFLAAMLVLYKTNHVDEPVDWPILLLTAALGFAALENALFLLQPIALGETTVGLLTGQLRFLGSTLLHAVSSGIIGIALGLSFRMEGWKQKWYFLIGLILAITLHSTFNFFIMKDNGNDFLRTFGFLWVVTIIIMLLFEKLRRME